MAAVLGERDPQPRELARFRAVVGGALGERDPPPSAAEIERILTQLASVEPPAEEVVAAFWPAASKLRSETHDRLAWRLFESGSRAERVLSRLLLTGSHTIDAWPPGSCRTRV